MSERIKNMKELYASINEDERLISTQRGMLEYMTTMTYIHKYANVHDRVIEIGAGTGRYSIALAKEGYEVTAVELVEYNLEIMKKKSARLSNLAAVQADALDLSMFDSDSFDITLVLGPMYHLYDLKDLHKAVNEAIRITRPGGILMFAFLSIYAIIMTNYLYGDLKGGLDLNYGFDLAFENDFTVKHTEDQIFTGFDIREFEELFTHKNVTYLKTIATDGVLELGERMGLDALSESSFDLFSKYHLATCEVREMLGSSSHLLYICRKNNQ